jgi:hypothetical protein
MNKFYSLILSILTLSLNLNAQVSENFDSYSDASYGTSVENYGTFNTFQAVSETTKARTGKSVRIKNTAGSYFEYVGDGNGIDGGVGVISFWYRSWDSSPTAVYDVQLSINGAAYTNIGSQISYDSETYTEWTHTLNNSADDIKVKIIGISGERLIIDDFSVTNYTAPSTSTINLNTTGGSYASERWVSITTAINGGGTLVWGQNNCTSYTSSLCRGALVNTDVDIAPGTYYVNCYDSYGDGWGTGNNFTVTAYGSTLASAYVGNDNASGNNLEASLMIVVPAAPSCLPPTALTATNLTPTSADLGWTAGGTETYWELV